MSNEEAEAKLIADLKAAGIVQDFILIKNRYWSEKTGWVDWPLAENRQSDKK